MGVDVRLETDEGGDAALPGQEEAKQRAGRPEIAAWQNSWALVLVVPLTVLLTLRFGLTGAALSWVLYHVFAYAYGLPRLCRVIDITLASWGRQLCRVTVLGAFTYGAAWLIVGRGSTDAPLLAAGFVAASLAFVLVGYRIIGAELRASLRRRIDSVRGQELHAAA